MRLPCLDELQVVILLGGTRPAIVRRAADYPEFLMQNALCLGKSNAPEVEGVFDLADGCPCCRLQETLASIEMHNAEFRFESSGTACLVLSSDQVCQSVCGCMCGVSTPCMPVVTSM